MGLISDQRKSWSVEVSSGVLGFIDEGEIGEAGGGVACLVAVRVVTG